MFFKNCLIALIYRSVVFLISVLVSHHFFSFNWLLDFLLNFLEKLQIFNVWMTWLDFFWRFRSFNQHLSPSCKLLSIIVHSDSHHFTKRCRQDKSISFLYLLYIPNLSVLELNKPFLSWFLFRVKPLKLFLLH